MVFPDSHRPDPGDLIANLPEVEELGWEARLGDPGAGLDHMLCLKRGDGSLESFLAWCATPPGREQGRRHPEWRRLGAFLGRLADETPPYPWFDNCWLEFDLAHRRPPREVPSLFIGLGAPLRGNSAGPGDLAGLLRVVGEVRGAPVPEPVSANLTRCWAALPDHAEIFQLGLMLPRDVSLFRLVVRDLPRDRLPEYLDAIGWRGPGQRVDALAGKLFRLSPAVSLAVTVGGRVHPGVGFECHLGPRTPAVTPRWEDFFQFLIALGLCRPEAWEHLRAWPGVEVLTTQGERRGGAEPYAIKGFDHVKVSYGDGGPLEAKLYFGALVKARRAPSPGVRGLQLSRSWRRHLLVRELAELPRPDAVAASVPLVASLDHLLREWCEDFPDAVHVMAFPFLDGFRNDSERQVGRVFPRAIIADALTDANEVWNGQLDPLLLEEVDAIVAERRVDPEQGWAYFPELSELPPDADTLAQVTQVLVRNGAGDALDAYARPLLDLAVDTAPADGAVSTWLLPGSGHTAAQDRQREFVRLAWGDTLDPEVIANFLHAVALLDDGDRYPGLLVAGARHLAGAMEPGGWWRSTWYQGPFYGTWVALRLLRRVDGDVPTESVDFLLRRQRPSGAWGCGDSDEVLSTALALLGLFEARVPGTPGEATIDAATDRGLDWLAGRSTTARWVGEPFIRMDLHRTGGHPRTVTWSSPTVTAAYVLKAAVAATRCRPPVR